MERVNYSDGRATWRAISRKDGKHWQCQLRYYEGGKRKTKSKVYPASKVLDTKRKQDTALREWIKELNEEQNRAIAKAEKERLEAERQRIEAERAANDVQLIAYIRKYIEDRADGGIITSSTQADYSHTCTRIERYFADVTLRGLTSKQVQKFEVSELRRGISPTTVGKAHRLLKQVLSYALKHEEVDKNVMVLVDPPKRPKQRPNGLDVDSARNLTDLLMGMGPTPVATAAMLALHGSLRAGECCGLKWGDVDLDSKVIHVRRSVGLGVGGAFLKEPKNNSSMRDVNITDDLVDKLTQRRASMIGELDASGVILTEDMFADLYVIGNIVGDYANPQVVGRRWTAISEEHGITGTEGKRLTFHGLRHGFATVNVALGADVASVASQMGHSIVSQTLNTYSSATAAGKERAAQNMSDAMRSDKRRYEAPVYQLKTGTTD